MTERLGEMSHGQALTWVINLKGICVTKIDLEKPTNKSITSITDIAIYTIRYTYNMHL